MIDIFNIIDEKRKQKAIDKLEHLQLLHAHRMEQSEYDAYIKGLTKAAGIEEKVEQFDRDKMDELHAFAAAMNG